LRCFYGLAITQSVKNSLRDFVDVCVTYTFKLTTYNSYVIYDTCFCTTFSVLSQTGPPATQLAGARHTSQEAATIRMGPPRLAGAHHTRDPYICLEKELPPQCRVNVGYHEAAAAAV